MSRKAPNKVSKTKRDRILTTDPDSTISHEKLPLKLDFTIIRRGPILILRFNSATAQHQALARMESYYESSTEAKKYLTLQDAQLKRLCPNYEAFNLPLSAVHDWLQAMREAEGVYNSQPQHKQQDTGTDETAKSTSPQQHCCWWTAFTNNNETQLLQRLHRADCLDTSPYAKDDSTPSYIISTTSNSAIPHELRHALYHLHAGYRATVQKEWDATLSNKTRAVIQRDLVLRGYGPRVWIDEFQAYVSEDAGEFGNKTRNECREVKGVLLAAQRNAWVELGMDAI